MDKSKAAVCIIPFYLVSVILPVTMASQRAPADGDSPWSLDRFLGVYDMDLSTRQMIAEFSNDILGVPSDVVEGGERIVLNKTDDGKKYQQFVLRNDSKYNVQTAFVLDKPDNVPFPKGWLLQYNYTMPTETSLLAIFSFFMGTYTAEFEILLTFKPDASGFHDDVRVLNPKQFTGSAEFYRVADDKQEMNAKPVKTEL